MSGAKYAPQTRTAARAAPAPAHPSSRFFSTPLLSHGRRDHVGAHGRVVDERRQNDGVLLQILLIDAFGRIHVRVMLADVVVRVVLDRVEARDSRADEAQVVGVPDAL